MGSTVWAIRMCQTPDVDSRQPQPAGPINVGDLVRRNAADVPDRVALIAADRTWTWAEVDEQAHRVASGLVGLGLVAGFRVAIALRNTAEFVTAYFGGLRAGLVMVPVNPDSTTDELARILTHTGARAIFAGPDAVTAARGAIDQLAPAAGGRPRLIATDVPAHADETPYDALVWPGTATPITPEDPEQLALLLHTSGTSTSPRAAMLTHRALLANLEQLASCRKPALVERDDRVLGLLPFFHVFGLNAVLGLAAYAGASVVLADRGDAATTLELVGRHRVTNIPAAPPTFQSWAARPDLRERLSGVRILLSGAAPLPQATADRFAEAGRPIHQGYGLTEAAPVVTCTVVGAARDGVPKPGSVGRPLPGVDVRVVPDPSGDGEGYAEGETGEEPAVEPAVEAASAAVRRVAGERAGRAVGDAVHRMTEQIAQAAGITAAVAGPSGDDPGEIHVRGRNLFSGYWPDGSDGPDEDGWCQTGDLGYLDAEGELFLVDRVKELVLVSGFNVYPREVEDVLEELPEVAAAAVVAAPDPRTGEAVHAYVVPAPDATLTVEAVRDQAAARLAKFKRPSVVEVVESLPRSAAGKVAKAELRRRARQRGVGTP